VPGFGAPAAAAGGFGAGGYGGQDQGQGYGQPGYGQDQGYGAPQPGYDDGHYNGYGQPGYGQDQGYPPAAPQPDGYGQPAYGDPYEQANGYPNGANGYGPAQTVPPPAYQQQQRVRHLLTVDGSQQWLELQVGSNVIGRGQDADLRLPDTGVSRRHVDIRFDGNGAVLHDLGSTNGTTVNGHRAQSWQLQHGDVVRVGHTVVVYRQEQA
jgi:hypothetical protein